MRQERNQQTTFGKRIFGRRDDIRETTEIIVGIMQGESPKIHVQMLNISRSGFQFSSVTPIRTSASILMQVGNYTPLAANIRWSVDQLYGCEFFNPLNNLMLQKILERSL